LIETLRMSMCADPIEQIRESTQIALRRGIIKL
jgi:hypothetical protein